MRKAIHGRYKSVTSCNGLKINNLESRLIGCRKDFLLQPLIKINSTVQVWKLQDTPSTSISSKPCSRGCKPSTISINTPNFAKI